MKTVVVTGADSFIGQHLISLLALEDGVQIRALVHGSEGNDKFNPNKISIIKGDILEPDSLNNLLVAGCSVINLAYLWHGAQEENLQALSNLVQLCRKAKVKRFVHCSTAVVAGRARGDLITEQTLCQPIDAYQKNKLAMEQFLFDQLINDCEAVILRPTGVFGPGGKNLLRLADGLTHGNRWFNYLKSSLFGQRRMNLVCVDNVVAAINFLLQIDKSINHEVFIISDDESPLNNYRDLETYLMQKFAINDYLFLPLSFLSMFLPLFLRLAKRANPNPNVTYTCKKLTDLGLIKPVTFEQGLNKFVNWYKKQ
ncbi:MAG: NAD(P)-dependent oxidoreductase [Candidatus Vogelbacteria bacterium]|nr:NAD(P)-dependent oxidoreductase [Candidatus Vogelbacteria bacterium]